MIGRRAFLASASHAAALAALPACVRRAAAPVPCAFDEPSPTLGHRLRGDLAALEREAMRARVERAGVVVVGGGVAGLSAVRRLTRAGITDVRLLELDADLGGTSSAGRSDVTAYPWGAHYVPVPRAENADLVGLLDEMGLVERIAPDGHVSIREPHLVREPETRIFEHGRFHEGERPTDGATGASRAQFDRFETLVRRSVASRDAEGRRAFDLPVDRSGRDAATLALDGMTAARFLAAEGLDDPRLLAYLDYGARDDFGCSLDTLSAWALMHYHASRRNVPEEEGPPYIAFPEGNRAFVAHLARGLDERARAGAMVVSIRDEGTFVRVVGFDARTSEPFRIEASRVVVATPKHVAARIVASVREDASRPFATFTYAPWVVANLHLREHPSTVGVPFAWDTVLAGSESLGYVTATHQSGRDRGPTVLTYYHALVDANPARARRTLLESSAERLGERVLRELRRAHPDIDRVTERVEIRRHGHAMIRPAPGFHSSPARLAARQPRGRIHFGHTDDSGMALFEEAFAQGLRAGDEASAALHAG